MKFFATLLNRPPKPSVEHTARLQAWQAIVKANKSQPLGSSRFVVVDVETSGLNLSKDNLIAIGAVAVINGQIDLADSFEVVLQQTVSSDKSNILIHGIGGETQAEGILPVEALLKFLEYLQQAPLVAFHVAFDETMLRRAIKQHLGFSFQHNWLDLAYVTPGLYPQHAQQFHSLDDWLNYFHIQNYARHNALADALSTAQLFIVASKTACTKKVSTYQELLLLEESQRWLKQS